MNIKIAGRVLCDYEYLFIEDEEKIVEDTKRKRKYSDGTVYHKFNKLNELTSKEWLKFQKSWFIFSPKPRKKDVMLHPAKFPEELIQQFIEFFTKKNGIVLDPMLGTGSTLVSCALSGRSGIGIELLEKYALVAKQIIESIIAKPKLELGSEVRKIILKIILGNALNLDKMGLPQIDYCITSPPYWDMLRQKGFKTQRERKKKGLDVFYSNDVNDLGNINDYDLFLDKLTEVFKKVYYLLKPFSYLTIIIKNVKKRGKIYPLAWDLANKLNKFFVLKDEKIWCQNDIRLAPYGYGNAWVSNTVHHYCLNFRKEV